MSITNKRDFDKEAATWDDNPGRVTLMGKVTEALMERVAIDCKTSVLDYGAGTGLVTLALAGRAGSVCAADGSEGMLTKLRIKADAAGLPHVTTLLLDLECQPPPKERFDLVVSTMTLHHIADAKGVVSKLAALLVSGGRLAIADLDCDGGEFHSDPTGVYHSGFDRGEINRYFRGAGLVDVSDSTAHAFMKEVVGKGLRPFSVFLVTGRRI
jgi:2-polyprenyl-3-methyl-5-hydroxy-6-metoxy-1,4-benzoquinol methylase